MEPISLSTPLMSRWLDVAPHPHLRAVSQRHLESFTPTPLAARALGVSRRSLYDLAVQTLVDRGISVASPLNAHRTLREAIRQTVAPRDLDGTTRAWMPSLKALLQASPRLDPTMAGVSARANVLIHVAHAYRHRLRQQGWVDGQDVLWQALEQPPERRSCLIYGYFYPRLDEVAWIEAIAGDGSLFYLPIDEHNVFTHHQALRQQLEQHGWQIVHHASSAPPEPTLGSSLADQFLGKTPSWPSTSAQVVVHPYATRNAEVRGVLAQIKHQLHEGIPARDIALIARNEPDWGPLLLDIAWEYGIPLRALYSIPLTATRVGAWLALLLEVIQHQFPFEQTARLLSHPLSVGADAELWSIVRRQRPATIDDWQAIVRDLGGPDLSTLKLPTRARRDTWVEKLQAIFHAFHLRRRAARWPRESVAYNVLETGLVAIAHPEAEILNWATFADELRASLATLTTPAQPGRGGVELHSPSSIMGARYRKVFVIGNLEGTLPAPVRNDPVLDFQERQHLQQHGLSIAGAAELARQEAFHIYALLQTVTEQLTLSFAQQDGEPSAYLEQLGRPMTSPPTTAIASVEEARRIYLRQSERLEDDVLERAIAALEIEQQRANPHSENDYNGAVKIPFDIHQHWFSASQLTQLGQCPFRWFAGHVLKLEDLQEPDADLNPGLRGTLYHKVLELALKAAQEDSTLDITDTTRLHAWFVAAEAAVQFPALPAWPSRRVEHIQILRRAMQQPAFQPAGAEVLGLEQEFRGEWHGFNIRGYVDRIDRTDRGLILMDYKTSRQAPIGVKDETGKATLDLQRPLYQAIAAPALYPDEPVHRTVYYSLTAAKEITPRSTPTEVELKAIAERLKTHLTIGHYPVAPDRERRACTYCAYDSMCRQGNVSATPETPATQEK